MDERILTEHDYRNMFKNCVSITFPKEMKIETQNVNVVTQLETDGFDWEENFKNAYGL